MQFQDVLVISRRRKKTIGKYLTKLVFPVLKTIVPLNVHKKDDKNKTTQVVPPTVTTPKPTLAPTAHQPVSTIVQTLLQSLPDTDQSVALLRNIKEQYALTFQRIPWSKRSRARTVSVVLSAFILKS